MEDESRRRRLRQIAAGRKCIQGRGHTRVRAHRGHQHRRPCRRAPGARPPARELTSLPCSRCRRVIAADGFLRRFRSLHGPLVVGHFYAGADTAFVPAPTQPAEDATAGDVSSHVSLSFLCRNFATTSDLFLTDSRGGLLAFVRWDPKDIVSSRWTRYPRVVVCDPWTRQHRVVPSPTPGQALVCLGTFLLDADEAGTVPDMSNFRLLRAYLVRDTQNMRIYAQVSMFSAKEDRWVLLTSPIVDDNGVCVAALLSGPNISKVCVERAGGSLFWSFRGRYVVHVNESTGAFSSFLIPFPPGQSGFYWDTYDRRKLRVVGNAAREVRVVCIVGEENLEVFRLMHGQEGEPRAETWRRRAAAGV
ncbi:hypothetical protein EJB05_50635, partial [Eragrostis curvula]